MFDCDRTDQFLHQDSLADTGTAEETDLSALDIGTEKVDDLDACLQDLDIGLLLLKGRRLLVDDVFADVFIQGLQTVDGFSQQIEHPS